MPKITIPRDGDKRQLVKAQEFARTALDSYGLTEWKLQWTRSKKDAGSCYYPTKTLKLSAPLLSVWTWAQVEDTVLHEIAHALTPGHKHDHVWKAKCVEIGAAPRSTWGKDNERTLYKYEGTCPAGHTLGRQRKPTKPISCGTCAPSFDRRYLVKWKEVKH